MLKKQKKLILRHKYKLLNNNYYTFYQIQRFYKFNNNLPCLNRVFFFKKNYLFKNLNICLLSGKQRSVNTYLKLNRNISNSLVRFNYFANIKSFGK